MILHLRYERVAIHLTALRIKRRILQQRGKRIHRGRQRPLGGARRIQSCAHQRGIRQFCGKRLGFLQLFLSLRQLLFPGEILLIPRPELGLGLLERLYRIVVLDPAHPQSGIALLQLLAALLHTGLCRGVHCQVPAIGEHVFLILLTHRVKAPVSGLIGCAHAVDFFGQKRRLVRFIRKPLDIGILFCSAVRGFLDTDAAGEQRDRAHDREKGGEKARQSRVTQDDSLRACSGF